MKTLPSLPLLFLVLGPLAAPRLGAWDYEGHRAVNLIALASLPTNFPSWVRPSAARERLAFLGGEADRWRNVADLPLRHDNGPDHYLDLEQLALYGLRPETLPMFRYDFAAQLALARAAHPERFPAMDPLRNEDHTRELAGFLPWALTEYYGKLKSGFSSLQALEEAGTPPEVRNAQENLIYVMGVMGHFAADAAQPLHTTIHHHGWVGNNPRHYATNSSLHGWIDGGYFAQTGGIDVPKLTARARPAQVLEDSGRAGEIFQRILAFVVEQQQQVEPLYQLYAEQKFSGEGEKGQEGRAFLEGQLVRGGELLGDLWLSAWRHAPEDRFLKDQLARRNNGSGSGRQTQ